MTVSIITIGDELLIGQIVDTNSAWMGEQLNIEGAIVKTIYSIEDNFEAIQHTLATALSQTDVVLLTGGLGPTKDDITKKALVAFFKDTFIFHEPTWNRIRQLFEKRGIEITPSHREQCYMPKSAQILLNKMGTAPGMWFENNGKIVVSMPGVPYEMKYLMTHEVLPKLKDFFPQSPILHRTILTAGVGESKIALRIQDIENNLPKELKLAYLPNIGGVRLRLTAKGNDKTYLEKMLSKYVQSIETTIPELIYGYDDATLEATIGQMLKDRNLTISTAESCTGGLLARQIASVPGASAYFEGSVVAYSYALKRSLLNVSNDTLLQYGAVSEETVREMAKGALDRLQTDIAVSISGIAGPTGGTPEKPVGTVWIAIADKTGNEETLKLQIGRDRALNIKYSALKALNLIRLFLNQYYPK